MSVGPQRRHNHPVNGLHLYHFSEDPTIERFVPHVPATNPTHEPAVWAIDAQHAPLYWFPRDCPRVTAWPRSETERREFEAAFGTTAERVHAVEHTWVDRIRAAELSRYSSLPGRFASRGISKAVTIH